MSPTKHGTSDQLDISLLESYRLRRIAIAKMPELPPSPRPRQFSDLTQSEFEEDRAHRIDHLAGRVKKAFNAAKGNPADGRWGALKDLLSLSCTAGRDGRWVGLRLDPPPEDEEDDEVLEQLGVTLANTEEEWFAWESRYERRWNLRRRVAEWSKNVEPDMEIVPSPKKTRRKSRLHEVANADELPTQEVAVEAPQMAVEVPPVVVEAPPVVVEAPPVAPVSPPTPKRRVRVARMSTGGKSPKKPQPAQVTVVSSTVPDALKNNSPFGFGVVKRSTAKGKEKAKPTPDKEKHEQDKETTSAKKDEEKERKRRAKEEEELKKRQERIDWEKERQRKLREAREKEVEKAREEKEREETERRRQEEEEAARQKQLAEEEAVVDKGKGKVDDRQMQIQDISEMSFYPPSFPSSAVVHSTPKPPTRAAIPFALRNTSPPVQSFDETTEKPVDVSRPAAEESSYSLGISMASSVDFPSQIVNIKKIPPPAPVPVTEAPVPTKKRARPVSPSPSPVVRSQRPEKKARNDKVLEESPSQQVQQDSIEDMSQISFIPPSFPPGGIVTSTPKPPSKSKSPEKLKAKGSPKQRETTPQPKSSLPTRPFLLPPTPKNRALEPSSSLPAIPSQSSPSPSSPHRQSHKRPASPTTPSRETTLKKARTMPATPLSSPPVSPSQQRSSPAKAVKVPDSWLRSPTSHRKADHQPTAEEAAISRVMRVNVRHVLAAHQRTMSKENAQGTTENVDVDVQTPAAPLLPLPAQGAVGDETPVTPQKNRKALPTLTELLASSSRSRKGKGSASPKKMRQTFIVRTPSGERVDVMTPRKKVQAKAEAAPPVESQEAVVQPSQGEEQENEHDESVRDNAEPSTLGTGRENYQHLKAAANASTDIFNDDSAPQDFGSGIDHAVPESEPAPHSERRAEPIDPYSDAYHYAEDIIVPTGSKLRTFPGAGDSYPFANGRRSVDPYADNPYDDPYASAGENVGISPTKSLSSLAGSDSDSDGAPDDSDDGLGPTNALRANKRTRDFAAGVLSPGFMFEPNAASTQLPPGLNFGVGAGGASSLFSAATAGRGSAAPAQDPPAAASSAKPLESQSSKDSWASMYASSAPADAVPSAPILPLSGDSLKDPSPQYALPEVPQPAPSSSSPVQTGQNSSPVRAPPSSNPLFSFSSQAFGDNIAKHVDMVSRLLDKDVDFSGWLKDPEEVDEQPRGVEESP